MSADLFIMRAIHIKNGWRFCHNKSARKHRKAGHTVHYFGDGEYRWRKDGAE